MQVCTSLQTDNHASTSPFSFFTGRMPFCCPIDSVKALKAVALKAVHVAISQYFADRVSVES